MARYFGTNGIMGRIDELIPQLALTLSQAIGIYSRKRKKRSTRVLKPKRWRNNTKI